MLTIGKLVMAFVTALTYPPVEDARDTFVMDLVCNLDDDCEIVVNPTETHYASRCEEDEPCWNCATMGNKVCGPNH